MNLDGIAVYAHAKWKLVARRFNNGNNIDDNDDYLETYRSAITFAVSVIRQWRRPSYLDHAIEIKSGTALYFYHEGLILIAN